MNKLKFLAAGLVAVSVFFSSCEDNNEIESGLYGNGAFISNEGGWENANASVSYYDFDKDVITNDIYETKNKVVLGDVLQSICINNNKVYLVLNGSNKAEVVTKDSFARIGTINNLQMPRYMCVASGKGYITQWADYTKGYVAVVNLSSNEIISNINVGLGPEGIIVVNNQVWVANSGGLAPDSTIMVIDPITDKVVKTITVGDNPKEMVLDKNGDVWAVCYGNIVYNPDFTIQSQTASKLVKISSSTFMIKNTIKIGDESHPSHIDISKDKQTIYYGAGFGFEGIWSLNINATSIQDQATINGYFYSFNINSNSGEIYTCEAPDFNSPGTLTRYTPDGQKIKSYTTGVGPNGIVFK